MAKKNKYKSLNQKKGINKNHNNESDSNSKKTKDSLNKIKFRNFLKNNSFIIGFFLLIIIIGFVSIISGNNDKSNNMSNENTIYGDDIIEMYYFHWTRCPHCLKQNLFNDKLIEKYPNLKINVYEITQAGSKEKYEELAPLFDNLPNSWNKFPGTPLTIIGDEYNSGFGSEETSGKKLEAMIKKKQLEIDSNWDSNTMKKTIVLQNELINNK